MSNNQVTFNETNQPEFYKELRRRVNAHFTENKISKFANFNMKFKTIFMVFLYSIPLFIMFTGIITNVWVMIGLWAIMGFGMAGIGLAVMHDANHGAYSSDHRVNSFVGWILNYIGGYHNNWKIQHNVLHHSYTNIDGHDEDISKQGLVRFSPSQERKRFFALQSLYIPILYSIMTLYWFVFKDIEQTVRYKKKDLLKTQGLTFGKAMVQIIAFKLLYLGFTIILPIVLMDFLWWQVLLGFLTMQLICGMILALIFQCAHVIEETEFYSVEESGSMENNWAIHQLKTTANFANNSKLFSWYIGALNFQIEHHLFPTICHVHYKDISKIVETTAHEYGLPYHKHKTFFGALKSHFGLLHRLGTGAYDKEMLRKVA
jgi:linoleoyl-CoA desaturase